ncbi:MAG: sugar nucleotide-binding protein [Anaerolineales bacterium]|nr:sugar nucleotide-binding protein [Anaerolineales bacterium]
MNSKTLLLTGASGYLGQHVAVRAAERYHLYSTFGANPAGITAGQPVQLDLGDRAAIHQTINQLKPQAIIHAAAVNPGSGDAAAMQRINTDGSRYVAEAAVAVGARLVFVSTDVVHSGLQPPYADDAAPTPINDYGRSKAAAEAAVAEVDPSAAIARTSLIYGLEKMDRGTAGFVERLESGQTLILFSDVIRNPVWVESLAEALLKLVERDFAGTLNVVGRQAMSRELFGRRLLAYWGIETGSRVQPGRAVDISATIPLDLRLTCAKAEQLLQMTLYGVDEVLAMNAP